MWTRVNGMTVSRFRKDERGAILVFFAITCAAIFLIASLSFDLGRRASTQSELQSFVDNVALAAAGELDGLSGAYDRAKKAADELVEDNFVIGEGDRTLAGAVDYNIYFYPELPEKDGDPLVNLILDTDTDRDFRARFVHVSLFPDAGPNAADNRVAVPWVFARILSIFSSDPLPDDKVGAEAIAGYTSINCNVAPVFFCLPETPEDQAELGINFAQNNGTYTNFTATGKTILLRDQQQGWAPGDFTWLDAEELIPTETLVDAGGPCATLTGSNLYECLVSADGPADYCWVNGALVPYPGNKNGIAPAVFNTRMDMYNASSSQNTSSIYRPAPIVTKAYEENGTCGGGTDTTDDATDFPPDDCFETSPYSGCITFTTNSSTEPRFGDGVWDEARLNYVDTNYAKDTNFGSIEMRDVTNVDASGVPGDLMTIDGKIYHKADPFRPEWGGAVDGSNPYDYSLFSKGDTVNSALQGFPVVEAGDTRFNYYQAEVAASYFNNPDAIFNGGDWDPSASGVTLKNSPTDLIQDFDYLADPLDPTSTTNYVRQGTSLPHCSDYTYPDSLLATLDPRRRVIVAAVVDCGAEDNEDVLKGAKSKKKGGIRAEGFVEIFIQSVFGGVTTPGTGDVYVEVVGPYGRGNVAGGGGRFDFVQLYW